MQMGVANGSQTMYNSNSHNRTTSGFSKELKKTSFKGGKMGNNKMTTKQYNL